MKASEAEELKPVADNPEETILTPLGIRVKRKNLTRHERIECNFCGLAVLEDEYGTCHQCKQVSLCLYCYEAGCPNCARIDESYD